MKKSHRDRIALIDRLEKKYTKKVRLQHLRKHQRHLQQSMRILRGNSVVDDDFPYETIDLIGSNRRRAAY